MANDSISNYLQDPIDIALAKELRLTDKGMANLFIYSSAVKKEAYDSLKAAIHLNGSSAYNFFLKACANIAKSRGEYPNYKDMYGMLETFNIDKNSPGVNVSKELSSKNIAYSRQKECDERWLKKYLDKKIAEHRADPRPLRKQQRPKGIKMLASWCVFFDLDAPHPSGDGTMGRMYFGEPDPNYVVPEGECESLEEYHFRIQRENEEKVNNEGIRKAGCQNNYRGSQCRKELKK